MREILLRGSASHEAANTGRADHGDKPRVLKPRGCLHLKS
jgi:hypothetical protein